MIEEKLPLISILIANYNNGIYIDKAINSVLIQTYRNFEIIIVDDFSTDNSRDIYNKYKDDLRINFFYNDKNYGCGYTKARCINESKGIYCGFLDPDDTLESNAVSSVYEKISSNNELSLVTSRHRVCDVDFKQLSISKQNKHLNTGETYFTSNNFLVTAFTLFSKNKYMMTNGINIQLKRAVDQDLYYKLEEVGSISFLNEVLYNYRNVEGSLAIGKNSLKAKYWHALVIKDTFNRRKSNGVTNISNDALNKVFEDLFIWKTIDKIENREVCLSLYFIFKSFMVRPLHNIKYKLSLLRRCVFNKSKI